MLKRILNLFRQDLTAITRDSIILYVFAAPVLLAILGRILLPAFQDTVPTVVVEPSVPPGIQESLAEYADVVVADGVDDLERRVRQTDDVAGVRRAAGADRYELVFEGNESAESEELFRTIAAASFGHIRPAPVTFEVLADTEDNFTGYATLIMVLTATLLGGMIAGFNIVDDRNTGAVRALAVSPLRLREYLASRALFCMLFSVVAGLIVTVVILGGGVPFGRLVLSLIIGTPLVVIIGYAMGLIAKDQIAAIGLGKILIPVYMIPAVLPIFLPPAWHAVLYPFPNYWYFVAFENVFVGTSTLSFWPALGITAAGGAILVALLMPPMRRVIKLR
ncbi:MAG: ABC transporter permease [Spirochaetes bacterium]|jgi:ABC-2 type transport system permease protein|nr:ABC transporter permease [Spirochaetota bacterium]